MISRKAELPIPQILAIVLLVIVLALIGYWLYTNGIGFNQVSSEVVCKSKLGFYCNQWKMSSYQTKPGSQDFSADCSLITKDNKDKYYATDCCSYAWALSVTQASCENLS
jgi:hypothetical protein